MTPINETALYFVINGFDEGPNKRKEKNFFFKSIS